MSRIQKVVTAEIPRGVSAKNPGGYELITEGIPGGAFVSKECAEGIPEKISLPKFMDKSLEKFLKKIIETLQQEFPQKFVQEFLKILQEEFLDAIYSSETPGEIFLDPHGQTFGKISDEIPGKIAGEMDEAISEPILRGIPEGVSGIVLEKS